MTIDKRIKRLEKQSKTDRLPGTSITRVMHPESGFEWCIGIGNICMPKKFFTGKTVESALKQAEQFYNCPVA